MELRWPLRRLRQLSAGNRVAITVTLAVAVGVLVMVAVAYVIMRAQLIGDVDRALEREVDSYLAAVKAAQLEGVQDIHRVSETYVSARAGAEQPALVAVRFPGETAAILFAGSPIAPPPPFSAKSYKGSNKATTVPTADGPEYRVLTAPVRADTQTIAVVQTALDLSSVDQTTRDVVQALLAAAVLVVAGGALFSRRMARQALRPLHDAAVTAARVTHDNLSMRVLYNGPLDDVAMLVDSFNSMLARLENAFAQQRRFIADASHEMRTPLTIMQGHLDLLGVEGDVTPDQQATLDLVVDELERTSRMVTGLLSLARLEAADRPDFRELDLSEVVEEAVTRAQGLGQRRFSFNHGGRLLVRGNRDLLLEALLNLLSNAVSHTQEDGLIAVECDAREDMAWVEVRDDGPGIPVEDLDRIFDRFYRSPSRPRPGGGGGSGLGLAIARRLVELHQGTLTARNGEPGGAVFRLELPLLDPSRDR